MAVCDLRMAGDVWRRNEGHGPAERAVLGYATGVTRGLAQRILEMGSLGDGIVQNHAAGDEMRTLPLDLPARWPGDKPE